MTAPSPHGCKRCGYPKAELGSAPWRPVRAAYLAREVTDESVIAACDPSLCFGLADCDARARDWRALYFAECRRLASRAAPVEVRGVVKAIRDGEVLVFWDVPGGSLPWIRNWLPASPGARVGQGVTVAVTPDEEVRRG